MTSDQLLLEMGAEAYGLLTPDEVNAICGATDNVLYGAMKGFELLWKKFRPSYRLGKMYKKESDRYSEYYKIYCHYAQQVNAGYHGPGDDLTSVDFDKWRKGMK